MSVLRKLKRKSGADWRKAERKAERKKQAENVVSQNMVLVGSKVLKKIKDARIGVLLMCYVYLMYYEFKQPLPVLQKLPQYIDDLVWYLRYSYTEKGKLQQKPSFKLIDCCKQIKKEKQYIVEVREAYDLNDELLCHICKHIVQLECLLMWITVTKFSGFGKVRLGRLQKRLHEMETNMTYEEEEALRKKLQNELCFTFDECQEEDFSPWVWDKTRRMAS